MNSLTLFYLCNNNYFALDIMAVSMFQYCKQSRNCNCKLMNYSEVK